MKYFNPHFNILEQTLRKHRLSYFLVFIIISIIGSRCTDREPTADFVFENYSVLIIANELAKENHNSIDVIAPFFIDSMVFLPDKNSEYLELSCQSQPKKVKIYLENPCTGTQITFNTCDSTTIYQGTKAKREQLEFDIENLERINSCNKEKINQTIMDEVEKWYEDHPDGSMFIYGDPSLNRTTSMIDWPAQLFDNNIITFVSGLDSLRNKMTQLLKSSSEPKILILYHPPKALNPLFGGDEKGNKKDNTPHGLSIKSDKENNRDAQREEREPNIPLRIEFSEDRTKFQWTRPSTKATFKALIYEFGNPGKVFGSYDIDSESEMYIPSGLALNHSYVFQLDAYKGGKKTSCRKVKFSLNNRMLIDPTCKDKDEKCN
jgi:hypothetical protein